MNAKSQIVMIDNFDSFTYNLVDQFRQLGHSVVVFRNDSSIDKVFSTERLVNNNCTIVLSPGPGNPDSAGNTLNIIKQFSGKLPIMGICLGHQAIVQSFGGVIDTSNEIVHGKADTIEFKPHPIFAGMTSSFQAARYHSLIAKKVPKDLQIIASTGSTGTIGSTSSSSTEQVMAVVHKTKKIVGFQFHPESILTTQGSVLLENSLNWLNEPDQSVKNKVA